MDSLVGNSKTTLVVTASPHIFNRSETIRTLRFAKTAKSVKNKAKVNKELSKAQLEALVKKLRRENKKLKAKLALFEAELIKNGIELPIDDGKKAKRHKRAKSMKSLMSKDTKMSIFGTTNLNTSTTELLQELTMSDGPANTIRSQPLTMSDGPANTIRSQRKSMVILSESTMNISNNKLKKRGAMFGKVDESAYNKLKGELKSLHDELDRYQIESNGLTEQLKKKNVELEALTEELHASHDLAQQFDNLQESKKDIAMQLQSKQEELLEMQQIFESEREKFLSEKNELEEELNENKNDLQQYESVMDSMKLNNH